MLILSILNLLSRNKSGQYFCSTVFLISLIIVFGSGGFD